jgi:hypothetical protein
VPLEIMLVKAILLNKIGDAYDDLGEKQQALHFLQALPLLRALRDEKGEARAAVRISDIYIVR